ncbi:MAG: hypothetical protein ACR2ID_02185 [Chthoniobacterales bacterium]
MIKTLIRILPISWLTLELLAIVVSNGYAATTDSVSVKAVVATPALYNGRRVSVIGVATGDGPEIEVSDSVADAKRLDSKKALFVRGNARKNAHTRYDMRKVRVTGQVNTADHGVWGNPCALESATIEVLSERLAAAESPSGIFRNESQQTITVAIRGQISTQFQIAPGEAETRPLSRISAVEVRSQNKALLAREKIVQRVKTPFYDDNAAALYYRFANGRIERVLPEIGRKWRLKNI